MDAEGTALRESTETLVTGTETSSPVEVGSRRGRPIDLVYLGVADVALSMFWLRYMRHHPALAEIPNILHTVDGIPGSPLNVALIGTATNLKRVMRAAVAVDRQCLRHRQSAAQ